MRASSAGEAETPSLRRPGGGSGRSLRRGLAAVLVGAGLAACNAETPSAPSAFSVTQVFGEWKLSSRPDDCAPDLVYLDFARFNNPALPPDSIRLNGTWSIGDVPETRPLGGWLIRPTGLVQFELEEDLRVTGIFVNHQELSGAWDDAGTGCRARVRGLRIE